jgi:hypothetical protein
MRKLLAFALALAAGAIGAAGAQAGGWATVGVAPLPDGTSAGKPWAAELTVLQHGRTPLAGIRPTLTIRNAATGRALTFPAEPTGRAGVYRASVVFPKAGTWAFEVYDGFTQYGGARTHTFGNVEIAAPPGSGAFPTWPVVGGVLGALGLLGLWQAARRRAPRPVAQP